MPHGRPSLKDLWVWRHKIRPSSPFCAITPDTGIIWHTLRLLSLLPVKAHPSPNAATWHKASLLPQGLAVAGGGATACNLASRMGGRVVLGPVAAMPLLGWPPFGPAVATRPLLPPIGPPGHRCTPAAASPAPEVGAPGFCCATPAAYTVKATGMPHRPRHPLALPAVPR